MFGLDTDDLAKRSFRLALVIRLRAMSLPLNCNVDIVKKKISISTRNNALDGKFRKHPKENTLGIRELIKGLKLSRLHLRRVF